MSHKKDMCKHQKDLAACELGSRGMELGQSHGQSETGQRQSFILHK